ncbi:MAG TPA: flagellar motor protein MotB [Acidobacteriaceae bacterium]|nr:flagellar motor protein MotB [Acidobacteriaceae bacterium]
MAKPKMIVIVKKPRVHAGHHGGAWKVAYADFVTALMSLFIVLWLMNTNPSVRKAVAGYFNDPLGRSTLTGTDRSGSGDNLPITKDNIKTLKTRLEKSIHALDNLKALSDQIEITVTPEGLRIELLETKDGSFFQTGRAELNANGREILTVLARELGKVPNRIMIEGHTDARPYSGHAGYSNWDLSTDRANAARRLMQATGLRPDQVSQVRGYADQMLRVPSNPYDPSNRRISLIVQYIHSAPEAAVSDDAANKAAATHTASSVTAATASASAKLSPATPAPPRSAPSRSDGLATRLWNKLRHY